MVVSDIHDADNLLVKRHNHNIYIFEVFVGLVPYYDADTF